MLQHDYILEMIEQFVYVVAAALRKALESGDPEAMEDAEEAVALLLDLDASVALELSPDSLVTMMVLSGIADSVASYVCYTLARLGEAYAESGDLRLSELRLAQAQAVAESFGCDPDVAPEGLEDLP